MMKIEDAEDRKLHEELWKVAHNIMSQDASVWVNEKKKDPKNAVVFVAVFQEEEKCLYAWKHLMGRDPEDPEFRHTMDAGFRPLAHGVANMKVLEDLDVCYPGIAIDKNYELPFGNMLGIILTDNACTSILVPYTDLGKLLVCPITMAASKDVN